MDTLAICRKYRVRDPNPYARIVVQLLFVCETEECRKTKNYYDYLGINMIYPLLSP